MRSARGFFMMGWVGVSGGKADQRCVLGSISVAVDLFQRRGGLRGAQPWSAAGSDSATPPSEHAECETASLAQEIPQEEGDPQKTQKARKQRPQLRVFRVFRGSNSPPEIPSKGGVALTPATAVQGAWHFLAWTHLRRSANSAAWLPRIPASSSSATARPSSPRRIA